MPSNPDSQICFRDINLKEELEKFDSSAGQSAKWIVQSYFSIIHKENLKHLQELFNETEMLAIFQALNGTRFSPDTLLISFWRNVRDGIEEYHLDERLGFSLPELLGKIKNLSASELVTLALCMKALYSNKSYWVENSLEELKSIGLLKEEDDSKNQ